jgi:hypothetical protein
VEAAARSRRRVPVAIAALALVAMGLLGAVSRLGDAGGVDRDFTVDYISARVLTSGHAYDPTFDLASRELGLRRPIGVIEHRGNPHTPFGILATAPLARMSLRGAQTVWLLLMSLLIALAVFWASRIAGISAPSAAVIGIGSLAVPIVQKDLSFGQSNGLVLILIVAGWAALKARREGAAGLAVGSAVALKAFPGLLLLPMLAARRFRAVGAAVATAVAWTAVASQVMGWHAVRVGFVRAQTANFHVWRSAPTNVSLPGVAFRWLLRSAWRPHATNAPAAAFVLAFAAIAGCAAVAWNNRARASGDPFLATIPLMLLASPLSWDHYAVAALPVIVVLAARAGRAMSPIVALGCALVAIGGWPGLPLRADRISDLTQIFGYGLPTYGLVILAWAEWRRDPQRRASFGTGSPD